MFLTRGFGGSLRTTSNDPAAIMRSCCAVVRSDLRTDGVDPEEWRAEIRAKARADKIPVITIRDGWCENGRAREHSGGRTVAVPGGGKSNREVPAGTLASIRRDTGLDELR